MYGQEDPESEDRDDEEDDQTPIEFSKDEISQVYLMKKNMP
jgi:hypothetical protein